MKLILTDHARQRMEGRNITEEMVADAVQRPEVVLPSFRERKLARKEIGGKTLEVVFKRELDEIVVITVYWLEE